MNTDSLRFSMIYDIGESIPESYTTYSEVIPELNNLGTH